MKMNGFMAVISIVLLALAVFKAITTISPAHAQQEELNNILTTNQPIKEAMVISFLDGNKIPQDGAWWLEIPSKLRMAEIELLLKSEKISDLVPNEAQSGKMSTLYELLYHRFVIQRLDASEVRIEPQKPPLFQP